MANGHIEVIRTSQGKNFLTFDKIRTPYAYMMKGGLGFLPHPFFNKVLTENFQFMFC